MPRSREPQAWLWRAPVIAIERITQRQYLERIPLDSFTWGEAAELDRMVDAEVEAEMAVLEAICAWEGHDMRDGKVDYWGDDRETRCVRCGELEAEGEEG
jgi:hypothetical protein